MYTSLILPQPAKKACCSACAHGHSKCDGKGVGLFDVGVEWGLAEYAALGLGAYVLLSLFGDFQTAKKGFKRGYAAARAKG